jgi:phosphate transport system permease protein
MAVTSIQSGVRAARLQRTNNARALIRRAREGIIYGLLFACAVTTIVTTVAIVLVLLEVAFEFFKDVPLIDFFTGTKWTPLFQSKHFGILPLLSATILIAVVAMLFAVPIGLATAIYLSEYAPASLRAVVKPVLEVLAGIPTVVYGYFALQFIAPEIVRPLFETRSLFSALAASLAMAILILPLVASLSEDAMRAVPQALREGAYGLGANRFEVATRVIVPAALSGIVAAVILAMSRAVGETMVVTIAAGNIPILSWDPREQMQTMTAFMAQVSQGDTPRGSIEYNTIFAVGATLFAVTLLLNIGAQWLLARFREEYE